MIIPSIRQESALGKRLEWVSLAALLVMVLLSPNQFRYDEQCFAENTLLLDKFGPGPHFLRSIADQSPGPLFQYVHWILEPLTGLDPIPMRLANLGLFIVAGWLLSKCLNLSSTGSLAAQASVASTMATLLRSPTTWVIAGLALTEMPAMAFLAASLVLLRELTCGRRNVAWGCLQSVLAGFLLGLAVLGRTQFVVVIAAALVLCVKPGMRCFTLLFCLSASAMPLWVFRIWEGLVPPGVQSIQSGLNPYFGLLAIGYLAMITAFACPSWFALPRRALSAPATLTLVFIVLNWWFEIRTHVPLKTVATTLLPEELVHLVGVATPALLAGAALFYLISLVKRSTSTRDPVWFSFVCISLLLIALTCVKSSAQFSSRYVAQAIPFVILLSGELPPRQTIALLVGIVGNTLGAVSLVSYYLKQ